MRQLRFIIVVFLVFAPQIEAKGFNKTSDVRLSQKAKGGDFTVKTLNGDLKLSSISTPFALVYFGYTFCPDICPTSLATLGAALRSLEPVDQKKITAIFISVDPNRDSVEKLAEYTKFFHPSMIGATESEAKVKGIADLYGVEYKKHYPKAGEAYYSIDHSTQAFFVKRSGEVVEEIVHGTMPAKIKEMLKKYI
jgi:protein SCO1/2